MLKTETFQAATDHVKDWWNGTQSGSFVSMGVVSDGSYGIPKDIVFSFPVQIQNKQWKIVQGLKIDAFVRSKLDITTKQLLEEKEKAMAICNAA
jgi:malate dehydrogenase